ncbi:MAG: VanW family protein [Lachnospiraceae bacterium]|nr:VanW family protein [Lachnospiraceae bacterium]
MARKLPVCFFGIGIALILAVMAAGIGIKGKHNGRIAPGVQLFDAELSGLSFTEAESVFEELLPDVTLELICPILPEMKKEAEERAQEAGYGIGNNISVRINGNEWRLTAKVPVIRVLADETIERVSACSNDVKGWEWIYAAVLKRPFRIRQAEAELVWDVQCFSGLLSVCEGLLERKRQDAKIEWNNGAIFVKESQTGFRIDTESVFAEAQDIFAQVIERIKTAPADGVVVRIFLGGTAVMPMFSTAQAKKCDTKIAEFTTRYQSSKSGRAQNIAAGAAHLNAWVILPQQEFSTTAALLPFTEENGYTAGGAYINGVLSESIGGGVCQLSTTLYNALLRTKLEITERHAHSMPVAYIPPGQDAAIAVNYKDLKFKNTTDAPVLLLCEATGEEVSVTLYGTAKAARSNVTMESVVVEENEEGMTVEVYRLEQTEDGEILREHIGKNQYQYLKKENRAQDGAN